MPSGQCVYDHLGFGAASETVVPRYGKRAMNEMSVIVDQRVLLDAKVQLAAQRIGALSRRATLEFALEVGKIVIGTLYGGDLYEWRGRGRKSNSLRALARHPDLAISPATLYRSLALYELSERVRPDSPWCHLGISHLRAVLSAPPPVQEYLLERAEKEGWSVARIEREVSGVSGRERHRGGRPRSPEYVKSIRKIGRLMGPEALQGLDEAERLDAHEMTELLAIVRKVRERISLVEHEFVRLLREDGGRGTSLVMR